MPYQLGHLMLNIVNSQTAWSLFLHDPKLFLRSVPSLASQAGMATLVYQRPRQNLPKPRAQNLQ